MPEDEHDIRYERIDGKVHRVHTVRSAPVDEAQTLNEYRGLILRKNSLLKDIRETEARLQALRPIAKAILDDHAEETPTEDMLPESATSEPDPDPEELARERDKLQNAARPENRNS